MARFIADRGDPESGIVVHLDSESFGGAVDNLPTTVPVKPRQFDSFKVPIAGSVRSQQVVE